MSSAEDTINRLHAEARTLPQRNSAADEQSIPFEARTVEQISAAPMPQVIQRLLYGVVVVVGGPNAGKSAFGVDACMSIAAGQPFFGHKVRSGPVLYVAAEAPDSILQRARATLREQFAGRRLPFYLVCDVPRLGDESAGALDLERLIVTVKTVASAEGESVRVVMLDTVAMILAGSDENSGGMLCLVAAAQALAQRTGACVVLLHHPSKADPQGLRGHSSLPAAADVIIGIAKDSLTDTRTATVTKSRDAPVGGEIHFRLEAVQQPEPDEFGDPVTTVIVRPAEVLPAKTGAKAHGQNQQRALTALREWARTHADAKVIAGDELAQLFKAHRIGRQRRPEVLDFLGRAGVLTASVGGYIVNLGALL